MLFFIGVFVAFALLGIMSEIADFICEHSTEDE